MKEMQICAGASLLRALSHVRRLRSLALNLALRWEGGQFYSRSARWIMAEYYRIGIGDYSYGECFVPRAFPTGVQIGRYVSIGPDVRVYLRDHPLERLSTHPFFYNSALGLLSEDNVNSGNLEIGHDAWIGARVIILKGCARIGIGAAIGAGAVVTRDVPDFALVAGNPARVVKLRFPEATCQEILETKWWEQPFSALAEHLDVMCRSVEHLDKPSLALFANWRCPDSSG
jgi:virginiamycin A acetyltransferase